MCWRTAATFHVAHRYADGTYQALDIKAANRHGQQLFFADMTRASQRRRQPQPRVGRPLPNAAPAAPRPQSGATGHPRVQRQLTLFDNNPPSFTARHGIPDATDHRRAEALDALARELAAQRGWSGTSLKRVLLGLKVLLGMHRRADVIRASDLDALTALGITSVSLTRAVLAEAGLFEDDQVPAIERWFTTQIADLPTGIRTELTVWFDVMRHGSSTSPRRRPRTDTTVRLHLFYAMEPIRHWARQGHQSLREISRENVIAALPPVGDRRVLAGAGLRSIFSVLRGRKLVFLNPTARISIGQIESGQPVPLEVEMIKDALHSTDPVRAALTALFAFYGLHPHQVRQLLLTDVHDRRLHIDTRALAIPAPVHDRLGAYLEHRTRRWPASLNPHLFINMHTAGHTSPVGPLWIQRTLQLPPRLLREDRILDEAHAAPGDARRICDLFDMSVAAALRYTNAVEHPELADHH